MVDQEGHSATPLLSLIPSWRFFVGNFRTHMDDLVSSSAVLRRSLPLFEKPPPDPLETHECPWTSLRNCFAATLSVRRKWVVRGKKSVKDPDSPCGVNAMVMCVNVTCFRSMEYVTRRPSRSQIQRFMRREQSSTSLLSRRACRIPQVHEHSRKFGS